MINFNNLFIVFGHTYQVLYLRAFEFIIRADYLMETEKKLFKYVWYYNSSSKSVNENCFRRVQKPNVILVILHY